jgi:hypothetical protein
LPKTTDDANGDSRNPLADRYADADAYVKELTARSEELVAAGLMLAGDIPVVVERGRSMYPAQ